MKVLYKGAESWIYQDNYQGEVAIVKERISKKYRISQIDDQLRKTRTRKEVKLLTDVRKFGVTTPKILHVNEKDYKIVMEFIDGRRIKELLNESDTEKVETVCLKIGKLIGKMHANGVVHGDLTTSNIILKDDRIYFIDFGLGDFSTRLEDQGVDLKLLYEALKSTHFKILKICWSNIVKGYKQEYSKADDVLEQVEEIEKRARYMDRQTERKGQA